MFKPDPNFNKTAPLTDVVCVGNEVDFKIDGKPYSGDLVGEFNAPVVRLRVTTYKHYKGYVSGAEIDQIQNLATHELAEPDYGTDSEDDVYWEVRFPLPVGQIQGLPPADDEFWVAEEEE